MRKDKQATKDLLIRAVGEVLAEVGFSGLGVNAVARKAGVDKVLIYRYFDSFDKLCIAFAQSTDFWPDIDEIIPDREALTAMSQAERVSVVSKQFTNSLRARPLSLEVLAWELIERNALTIELENVREAFGLELIEVLSALPDADDQTDTVDWVAVTTLMSAGFQYLAIRARKINTYNGIALNTDAGWARLEQGMENLFAQLIGH